MASLWKTMSTRIPNPELVAVLTAANRTLLGPRLPMNVSTEAEVLDISMKLACRLETLTLVQTGGDTVGHQAQAQAALLTGVQ